jgi:ribonuclease HII
MQSPTMRVEGRYFADGFATVAGVDEVGRGAWAGPVSVGVAVVTAGSSRRIPKGVRDSKQLTWAEREALYQPLSRAVADWAVGHASNEECDSLGMTAAQRLAARRAFDQLDVQPEMLLLDGKFDYLHYERPACEDEESPEQLAFGEGEGWDRTVVCTCPHPEAPIPIASDFPPVRLIVKGDASSKAIASASVLAKVTRDRLMAVESDHYPWYAFERNRGYPAPQHKMALATWGCTPLHRRSWAFVEGLLWQPGVRRSLRCLAHG